MPNHSAEAAYRKLVANTKAPQFSRIKALKFLTAPSLAMLQRLIADPTTPGRLAALACDLYALQIALKQVAKESKNAVHPGTIAN